MRKQLFSKFTVNQYDGLNILFNFIMMNFEGVLELRDRSMSLEFDNAVEYKKFINDIKKETSGWTLFEDGTCYTPNAIKIILN